MKEKIKVEVEIDREDYELFKKIGQKMNLTPRGIIQQEIDEKLAELEIWAHRFGLIHKEREN